MPQPRRSYLDFMLPRAVGDDRCPTCDGCGQRCAQDAERTVRCVTCPTCGGKGVVTARDARDGGDRPKASGG